MIRFTKEEMVAMHAPSARPACMDSVPPNLVADESLPPSTSAPIDLDQIFAEWSQQRQERRERGGRGRGRGRDGGGRGGAGRGDGAAPAPGVDDDAWASTAGGNEWKRGVKPPKRDDLWDDVAGSSTGGDPDDKALANMAEQSAKFRQDMNAFKLAESGGDGRSGDGAGAGAGAAGGVGAPPPNAWGSPDRAEKQQKYYYRDPQGEVQGPFEADDMRKWSADGYFQDALPIRYGENGAKTMGLVCNLPLWFFSKIYL